MPLGLADALFALALPLDAVDILVRGGRGRRRQRGLRLVRAAAEAAEAAGTMAVVPSPIRHTTDNFNIANLALVISFLAPRSGVGVQCRELHARDQSARRE